MTGLRHLNIAKALPGRTVVIGSAGFVGSALMKRLASAKVHAVGITRKDVDLRASDAADRLAALLRPGDAVVAVAARAPCKDIGMMVENMVMAKAMVEALSRVSVAQVVNISSDAVYADGPVPLDENSPIAPTSMHGAMHLAREIGFAGEVKGPLATLRPTLIYGAGDPHNGYGPNRFRRLAHEGKDIVLFGEGEERRDHVLVEDVAEIIVRVLQWRSAGALNIATGQVYSFRDIAERVVAAAARKVAIKGSSRKGPMPHNGYRPFNIAACQRAFPDFSYTPIDAGIAEAQRDVARI